jgi:uncharacterized protein (DUF433 family)
MVPLYNAVNTLKGSSPTATHSPMEAVAYQEVDVDRTTWLGWRQECRPMGQVLDYSQHIVRDPKVCGGQPIIKGTRVTLRTVLASLSEGATVGEILADFPALSEEDVRAVIAFAALSSEDDLPVPGAPDIHAHQD